MKKIIVFILVLVSFLLVESCKKEQIPPTEKSKTEVDTGKITDRSYQEEECGSISQLCPTCSQEAIAIHELQPRVSGVDNNTITLSIGDKEYVVHPAEFFLPSSNELLIKENNKEYLLSDTEAKLKSDAQTIEIPVAIELLKTIDQDAFKAGNITEAMIKDVLGQDVIVTDEGNGNFRVLVNNITTTTTSDKVWEDPCQGKSFDNTVKTVYTEVLGRNVPHSDYENIIANALLDFLDNFHLENGYKFDFKTDCVNTQDVVNSILLDPQIAGSSQAPYSIKLNYLTALLELSNEEYEWLYANGSSTHNAEIDALYSLLAVDSPNGQCADCGRILAEQAIVSLFINGTLTAANNTDIEVIDNFYGNLKCTNHDLYSFIYSTPNNLVKGAFAKVILSNLPELDLIDIIQKMELFYYDNRFSSKSVLNDFQFHTLELIASDNSFVYERFLELFTFLKNNPNGLIEDCAVSNPDIDWNDYIDLLNFAPPQSCINRLEYLNANFGIPFQVQPFEEANSYLTNMDYYGVEIIEFPEKYPGGPKMTQPELFEFIRANFLDVSKGYFQDFESNCGDPATDVSEEFFFYSDKWLSSSDDSDLWASAAPLTTMFYIDAWAEDVLPKIVADNGAVITSQFVDNCCWVFTTIKTPESGDQPFSGHRQFGLRTNSQNNVEFYARAIDRANIPLIMKLFRNKHCLEQDYYKIGDLTWSNLQQKVSDLVISNNGDAVIKEPVYEHLETPIVLDFMKI